MRGMNRLYDSLNVLYAVHGWNHGKNRHLNREYGFKYKVYMMERTV